MAAHDTPVSKSWSVHIDIGEYEGTTRATAHLKTGDQTSLSGTGSARLNPSDPDVPEIGDELATARALSDLAHNLLDAAADDISHVLNKPVDLSR
jgi:hypothetical protein